MRFMKRILHILGTLDVGGAETMVMNLLRAGMPIDIAVCIPGHGFYEDEAISLGAKIYHLPKRSCGFLRHHKCLKKIVKENRYKIIHINTQNAFLAYSQLQAVKAGGAEKIIVHSHNTMDWRGDWLLKLHEIFRKKLYRAADIKIACSTEAGEWLFGDVDVEIMPLPIDCQEFKRNGKERLETRDRLGIKEGERVLICVGRFSDVKNQSFLVYILKSLLNCKKAWKLILVGDGENMETVKERVKKLGLQDYVIFTGLTKNPASFLNAADIFVMPSFYEGFPTVILEAVAEELPCVISQNISKDFGRFKTIRKCSLEDGVEKWAEVIEDTGFDMPDLKNARKIVEDECNINIVAERIGKLYEL